ncbi:hypothetical protein N8H74_25140 [Pseudomonas sp. B2M1-30]|uniref:hypothetical protein n=1 Tax=Pseudomonas TaxID=286 RepID=UPI001C3DB5BE|nr:MULTISPECIES: hypothetical protein [Pseudomonas]MBV4475347.1 hypothetical protein [Pseudomonas botevensis]MCU0121561.1 hypothetical protein [Pseudomonas sp. B2M1-30]MCU7261289.1 hypothetical protein [Pseudomonas koreensis]
MSMTIGFSDPGKVTIGGRSVDTINALKKADQEAAEKAKDKDEGAPAQVRTGGAAPEEKADESGGAGGQSLTVKMLLKRMKELQKQLQEQQQQLAAAQAAKYPTEEAKTTAVTAVQGQIAQTNAALAVVAGSLAKELAKEAGSGSVINTTA